MQWPSGRMATVLPVAAMRNAISDCVLHRENLDQSLLTHTSSSSDLMPVCQTAATHARCSRCNEAPPCPFRLRVLPYHLARSPIYGSAPRCQEPRNVTARRHSLQSLQPIICKSLWHTPSESATFRVTDQFSNSNHPKCNPNQCTAGYKYSPVPRNQDNSRDGARPPTGAAVS